MALIRAVLLAFAAIACSSASERRQLPTHTFARDWAGIELPDDAVLEPSFEGKEIALRESAQ